MWHVVVFTEEDKVAVCPSSWYVEKVENASGHLPRGHQQQLLNLLNANFHQIVIGRHTLPEY